MCKSWPTVIPAYKHWVQRHRQMQQTASSHYWLIYLISIKTHALLWLACWLFQPKHIAATATAAQTRPSSPVSPKEYSLDTQRRRKKQSATLAFALKTAALKISSSPYWSASKARKCMFCSWGLGFPVDIRGSEVKGRPGSIFQKHKS